MWAWALKCESRWLVRGVQVVWGGWSVGCVEGWRGSGPDCRVHSPRHAPSLILFCGHWDVQDKIFRW